MGFPSWRYRAPAAGIVYLYLMLLGSSITLFLALYIFVRGARDQVLVPCAVLMVVATSASSAYILFHEHSARKRDLLIRTKGVDLGARKPVYIAARLLIALAMLWVLSSGWNMIIAARQPICLRRASTLRQWQIEGTCKAQRAGAAFSIINLLIVCAFFAYTATTRDPFESRLLGNNRRQQAEVTPYRDTATFRLSRGEQGLVLKRRISFDPIQPEKPLPKTPLSETRPLTPAVDLPDPLGLGRRNSVTPSLSIATAQTPSRPPPPPPSIQESPGSTTDREDSLVQSLDQPCRQSSHKIARSDSLSDRDTLQTAPAVITKDAWRTLHPPSRLHDYVPDKWSSSRPPSIQDPAVNENKSGTTSRLTVTTTQDPSLRSGSAYAYARSHTRNRSAPYAPMVPPKSPRLLMASINTPRKRGHIRCTSDPNEMISVHLAAEMQLATRLEAKLQEVSKKVEAGHSGQPRRGSHAGVIVVPASDASSAADEGQAVRSEADADRVRTEPRVKSESDVQGRLFAKMEWDMLMGKEVSVLD